MIPGGGGCRRLLILWGLFWGFWYDRRGPCGFGYIVLRRVDIGHPWAGFALLAKRLFLFRPMLMLPSVCTLRSRHCCVVNSRASLRQHTLHFTPTWSTRFAQCPDSKRCGSLLCSRLCNPISPPIIGLFLQHSHAKISQLYCFEMQSVAFLHESVRDQKRFRIPRRLPYMTPLAPVKSLCPHRAGERKISNHCVGQSPLDHQAWVSTPRWPSVAASGLHRISTHLSSLSLP